MIRRLTILTLLSFASALTSAQIDIKNAYRIEGNAIVLVLDNAWSRADQENLLDVSGMKGLSLDTLWRFGSIGRWAKDGWKVSKKGNTYKIYKLISTLSGNMKYKDAMLSNDALQKIREQTSATFGYNSFKKRSVISLSRGKTRFFLYGKQNATDVYLSGTFNGWSTLGAPMTKTDSGWVADVILQPGKHCYKFIVNGQWMSDPENRKREDDFHGDYNSVYFVTNKEFQLKGYDHAKRVVLTGSFNNWNENELSIQKTKSGWKTAIYLKEGVYNYKFIVDGNWITDPSNPLTRDDGTGNENSLIWLGDTVYFKLSGYTDARQVIVTGEFNGWNERELVMKKTAKGWQLPYVLAPGNYQYKFIVDGQWMTDPQNPHVGSKDGHENSVLAVKPNFTFKLKGSLNAKEVKVAGNFYDWDGFTMKKTNDGWAISVYLAPGKCLYKFIVDGNWIIDPDNKLWEQNEYNTGNSVLWFGMQ